MLIMYIYLENFLPSLYLSGNWAAAPCSGSSEQDVIQL